MPTIISKNDDLVTMINILIVTPENQQRVVDLLVEATNKIIKDLPGFVSANIHKSVDGVRVVNYAQWRSREDWEAMLNNPDARAHIKPITEFAESDAHLYEVVETVPVS